MKRNSMPAAVAFLGVAGALLSGCLTTREEASPDVGACAAPADPDWTTPCGLNPWQHPLQLEGCKILHATGYVPAAQVQGTLPPGYTPTSTVGVPGLAFPGMAGIQVNFFECALGLTAVGEPGGVSKWLQVEAVVDVPGEIRDEDRADFYLAELYADDAVASRQLAAAGFAWLRAAIDASDSSTGAVITVRGERGEVITVEVAAPLGEETPRMLAASRNHQKMNETAAWLDMDYGYVSLHNEPSPTRVSANQGVLTKWAGASQRLELVATRADAVGTVLIRLGNAE